MATVLKLSNGIETIDFISGSSDYRLLADDALQISMPESKRVFGGDPLLRKGEGSRLIERQYENREISIDFKITATDHNSWVEDIRRIDRVLNDAKEYSKKGYGNKVTLRFQLESASTDVYFDILDGDLSLPKIASAPLRREFKTIENSLTLIAKPLARATSIIQLDNWILNGDFCYNPGEYGRDSVGYYTFGVSGNRFERANTINLQPPAATVPELFVGAWIYLTSTPTNPGDEFIIASAGNNPSDATPANRPAWVLAIRKISDGLPRQLVFKIYTEAGILKEYVELDSRMTIPLNTNINVAGSISKTLFGAGLTIPFTVPATIVGTGTYRRIEVFINGKSGTSVLNTAIASIRQSTGKFTVGAYSDDSSRFVGRIAGLAVVIGTIEGYRQLALFYYGMTSLAGQTTTPNRWFWDLQSSEWGASWNFNDGLIFDGGPRALNLTIVGTPTFLANSVPPRGWTIGSGLTLSRAISLVSKYGFLSYLFLETVSGANKYIEQTWSIPANRRKSTQKWTAVFWLRAYTSTLRSIDIIYGAKAALSSENVVAVQDTWTQYIVTFAGEGGTSTGKIRFEKLTGEGSIVYIDGVEILEGEPFGVFATITPTSGKPYIDSRFCAMPDSSLNLDYSVKRNTIAVRDLPGDQPAAIRLFIQNKEPAYGMGPIRVGQVSKAEPSKFISCYPSSLLLPQNNVRPLVLQTSGQVPGESRVCMIRDLDDFQGSGFEELVYGIMGGLFPFPDQQRGAFKVIADVFVEGDTFEGDLFFRASSLFPLTRDPSNLSNILRRFVKVDAGLLYWLPLYTLRFRELPGSATKGEISSHRTIMESESTTRLALEAYPSVVTPATEGIGISVIHLLPVEDGYYGFFPDINRKNYLEPNKILVIDSINEETSYIVNDSAYAVLNAEAVLDETLTLNIEAASSINTIGNSFRLEPQEKNLFTFLIEQSQDGFPLGNSMSGMQFEAWIEYEARYLYV